YLTNGADAGTDGPWCMQEEPTASFCADFDEGTLMSGYQLGMLKKIPPPVVDNGGDAGIGSMASSPPGDFTASAPAVLDGGMRRVRYEEPVTLTSRTSTSRLRLDVRLPQATPDAEVDLANLDVHPQGGGPPARLYLSVRPSQGQGMIDLVND